MLSILKKIFGTANDRIIKKFTDEVTKINALEAIIKNLTDQELSGKTLEFKERLSKGETLDDIAYEAFAVVREAALRACSMRHFDVQLIGGLLLHRGYITEMRTGEGKTLVATLSAYLNALSGKGVHVVTVNDYLATRDSEWMGNIYNFLGLTVGCIVSNLGEEERKAAYNADITYATNNELGFDYLRDNMKFNEESKVLRKFNYAIIDEVDSILIDEARTPLIISGPVDDNSDLYFKIDRLIKLLDKEDYEKDEKLKVVNLTEKGIVKIEELLLKNELIKTNTSLYDVENLNLVHFINQSLKAHTLFSKDVDYLLKDGKVMIIDEFTGRIMEHRRYSDGLHQSLEAKENVEILNENQTLASITFQNYFRLYPKLSGMTGTAMTEAAELKDIYNLDVFTVPTHNPITRIDHHDEIYGNREDKYKAIIKLIKDCYERKQPLLIGTITIEKSEELSKLLTLNNIPHNVLNAKSHEKEAYIIAQAGRLGAVTIATNMAGRGTDIMLGGNSEMLISQLDKKKFNSTQYDLEINRIKNQINTEKDEVRSIGGLYVIGTERHESRRIDNQLRGRAGRQGDPGATKFFLSLEDDLMRLFASERTSNLLRNLGLKDGEAIQHSMISKSLEKAQQKVESHNYEIRKNLLRYDDVMNDQRKTIYEQRAEIISSSDVNDYIDNMLQILIEEKVSIFIKAASYREDWDIEGLIREIHRVFNIDIDKTSITAENVSETEITELVISKVSFLFNQQNAAYGIDAINKIKKYILITTLDSVWKDHLHNLDHLRQGICLRAYGQKEPLNEYKREAFELFSNMLDNLKEVLIEKICHLNMDHTHFNSSAIQLTEKNQDQLHHIKTESPQEEYLVASNSNFVAANSKIINNVDRDPNNPNTWGKVFRNEFCPCNSGKKYKHCHGQ